MSPKRLFMRRPAHVINGISVALGVATIQLPIALLAGRYAALAAVSGAICASLADLPLVPARTWRRVGTGAVVGWASVLLVSLLRESGAAMGLTVMLLSFGAMMAWSWGVRAGPLAFIPMLALVFTLAAPPPPSLAVIGLHSAWTALGAGLYVLWACASSRLLLPRYRTLALAGALDALAGLLRSRAALLARTADEDATPPLQAWIGSQVTLDERLQAARNFLFPAAAQPRMRAGIDVLLLVVEVRDAVLASELDVEWLGHDAAAGVLRLRLGDTLDRFGDAIAMLAQALRDDGLAPRLPALPSVALDLAPPQAGGWFGAADARLPLVHAFANRVRQLDQMLQAMDAALRRPATTPMPLSAAELGLFISPEGWPLAAVRAQCSPASPVLRHAVRMALAAGTAYFIGRVLPWASHPHWLVLSVAVVLRGNLEQTLSRRNDRVLGTVIGCFIVLALAQLGQRTLSTAVFLVAVGVAHSYLTQRYLVTAAAASVMALAQAHMAMPDAGVGAWERIGDTLIGAALAWGFSYVWPWWERRGVRRLCARVRKSLRALADEVLQWPDPGRSDLQLRLARREVYEAIGAIAGVAQRTAAEPESVRLPMYALAELLTRSHVMMAQLASLRLLLLRRRAQFDPAWAPALLREATRTLHVALEAAPAAAAAPVSRAPATATVTAPVPVPAEVPVDRDDEAAGAVPLNLADEAVRPWLQRRLALLARAAVKVDRAAVALELAGRAR